MNPSISWIESAGGPLIFLSAEAAIHWNGARASANGASDYERACAVVDQIGTLRVADAMALVLGDEPDRTCLLRRDDDIVVLRWRWAESEEQLFSAFEAAWHGLAFEDGPIFTSIPAGHVLFDSACAGSEVESCLRISLEQRTYRLATALLNQRNDLCVLVHRLRPMKR